MTKKRFIKKCMSCGFSRNEARLLCEFVKKTSKERTDENKMLKAHKINWRAPILTYAGIYKLRRGYAFHILKLLKNKKEIKPIAASVGRANGKRATVTNIDEMHTYRKVDHEKETVY